MTAAPVSMLAPRVLVPFGLVTLIWGSTWLVIRGQLGIVDPSWSVTYRFLIGGTVMLLYAWISGHSLRLGRAGQIFALLFGVAQFVLNFNFVYRAEHYVTSGLVAVVFAMLIVPNAILSRLFLGNRFSLRFIGGSCVAIAGVALLFTHEARAHPSAAVATLTGVGFTLMGVLCASIANVMQATDRARAMPMPSLIGWGMIWGSAIDALYAWLSAGPPVIEWSATYLGGLAYLSIVASAVAFSLYFQTIRDIGPARAAYSSVLIPIIAMMLSTVFEGYQWSLMAAAGGILVLGGMVLALSPARPAAAQQADSPARGN